MSGHSKWSTIKHKKAKVDSQRAVVFQKYSRELIVSARLGGPDPAGNFRLRTAIEKAKAAGLPNDNIKRAIDKGAGAGGVENYEELIYEGYASGGVDYMPKSGDKDTQKPVKPSSPCFGGGGGRGVGSVTEAYVPVISAIGSGSGVSVGGFNDLEGFEWAQDAIRHLSSGKIISGRGNGSFDPMAQVTRAEFVKMVVKAFGISEVQYNGNFEDVPQDSWYAEYVAAASNIGVVTGIDATHFAPDAPISRQDMIVLLYRAAGFSASANEKDVFTDSYAISDYAKSAVYALYEKGMVLGDGNGILEPLRSASRAEAAQMIYNIIK